MSSEKVLTKEFIARLSLETGLSQAAVGKVVRAIGPTIASYAVTGRQVNFPGLGRFCFVVRKAREYHIPKTRLVKMLPAKRALVFRAANYHRDYHLE